MTGSCFVICENGSAISLSLVAEAVRMTEEYGREGQALILFGSGRERAVEGISQVHALELREEETDEAELAVLLAAWFQELRPDIILANATVRLRALMPMIAARLGCGLTADCTALELRNDGSLIEVRPALGGNVLAGIVSMARPQMATVRAGIFPPAGGTGVCVSAAGGEDNGMTDPGLPGRHEGVLKKLQINIQKRVKCLAYYRSEKQNILSEAEIVVAGGAGIGSREGFTLLEKLASCLNGCIGATRSAVNLGYASYSCQIGQTGQVVRPKLYLAVGISGAVQHLAGMSGAGTVIAVNSDRNAPIFDYADYGMVGDWRSVTEQLVDYFEKGRGESEL